VGAGKRAAPCRQERIVSLLAQGHVPGTDKIQGTINRDITVEEDIEDRLNSTDAGIVFNLSYKLQPSFGTGINVRYYLGLTDTIKDNPGDAIYNRVLSVFVSVAIGEDPSEKEDE